MEDDELNQYLDKQLKKNKQEADKRREERYCSFYLDENRKRVYRDIEEYTMHLRFIERAHYPELVNLWHLSRVPTSGIVEGRRYQRLLWTSKEFVKKFPQYTDTEVYKDLDTSTRSRIMNTKKG